MREVGREERNKKIILNIRFGEGGGYPISKNIIRKI